jgi:hypothetical protein
MNAVARAVWLVTGLAWAGESLLQFAHPQYWDPLTTLDWLAVWSFSASWLLLAATTILLGRLTGTPQVLAVATVVAIGAVAAGVANAFEDGLGIKSLGTIYVLGSLTAAFGLLALAATIHSSGFTRLARLTLVLFLGAAAVMAGGGLIVLGVLGALAVSPAWFIRPTQLPAATSTMAS